MADNASFDVVHRLSPKILEPGRGQLGISNCVLDIAMSQIGLQRPRIMAFVGKCITTGVA